MNSRERLEAALNHAQPDRVPVDFGATFVTGIHVSAVARLRRAVLGDRPGHRIKVCEPYQMLGEVDDELREALGIDVIGSLARKSIFGTDESAWKPFTFWDGTELLVPHNFNLTVEAETGDWLMYPEGDQSVPPSGRLPSGGYFFDAIIRQEPIDEANLNPADNAEEFKPFGQAEIEFYQSKKRWFQERAQCGVSLVIPGTAFGDIALVPAPFLKQPKGVRDVAEWYMTTAARPDYVREVFERQCEVGLRNLSTLIEIFGDVVQVAVVTGTDFGTQRGPFIKPSAYREGGGVQVFGQEVALRIDEEVRRQPTEGIGLQRLILVQVMPRCRIAWGQLRLCCLTKAAASSVDSSRARLRIDQSGVLGEFSRMGRSASMPPACMAQKQSRRSLPR
jgi:hypothetical protein